MIVRAVGLKVLKNRLAEYIRLVRAGETVLVTDRDRVVAEIVPPGPHRAEQATDALLAEVVRAGLLSPPLVTSAVPPPREPVLALADLMSGLQHDREDR